MGCGNSKNIDQNNVGPTNVASNLLSATQETYLQPQEINQQQFLIEAEPTSSKDSPNKLHQTKLNDGDRIRSPLRPLDSSWDVDQKLISDLGNRKRFPISDDSKIYLIDLEQSDLNYQFVLNLFKNSQLESQKQGLKGFSKVNIKRICLIDNPDHQGQFEKESYLLSQRRGNDAFTSKWDGMDRSDIRKKVLQIFEKKTKKYSDDRLNFLPVWHGTYEEKLKNILEIGFANLATTDLGYYGKGIYGTTSAEYAKRVYGGGYEDPLGILLLNWVGINSALMVAGIQDIDLLKGKGNHGNYDAHFIPVVPRNQYTHELGKEDIYFPLQLNSDDSTYDEIVVFGRQVLARYVVYTYKDQEENLLSFYMPPSFEEEYTKDAILKKISDNPWIAINYVKLSQFLKNNEVIELPNSAKEKVIARLLPINLLDQKNLQSQRYDAIALCQIGLYLDEKCGVAYYYLANALKKKLIPDKKIFLAFPIDRYLGSQELYQKALTCGNKVSLSNQFEKFSESRCTAKLAQNTSNRALARKQALEAITIDQNDPLGWIALGSILLPKESITILDDKIFNAETIFKKALELDPDSPEALLSLARLLPDLKSTVKIKLQELTCEDLLKKALNLRRDYLEAIDEFFNKYGRRNFSIDYDETRKFLLELLIENLHHYEDYSKVWELLSYCLNSKDPIVRFKDVEYDSKKLIEQAYRLDPSNTEICDKLDRLSDKEKSFDFLIEKIKSHNMVACKEIQQGMDLYVPMLGTTIQPPHQQISEEQLFPLEEHVKKYIDAFCSSVLWIQGNASSGKTLFGRHLEQLLWQEDPKFIPLFTVWFKDLLDDPLRKILQKQGFSEQNLETLEKKISSDQIRLILIIELENYCDFDENKLFSIKFGGQLIILSSKHPSLKISNRCYISPFSEHQIRIYLNKYVKNLKYNKDDWIIDKYEEFLDIYNVRILCKDPFLLQLILSVLPEFKEEDNKDSKAKCKNLTKSQIYEKFIEVWFNQKLNISKHFKKYKKELEERELKEKMLDFSQDLALELVKKNQNKLEWVNNDGSRDPLSRFFESPCKLERRNLKIWHEVGPIVSYIDWKKRDYYCSIVNTNIRDYLAAKKIIKELEQFQNCPEQAILNYSILEQMDLMYFIVEDIKNKPILQQNLIKIIEFSKDSDNWSIAAANAITILNQAGKSFANLDLSGIKIPNADLSGAHLDHAKLSNANLTKVKLKGAWLHGANLNGSDMLDVYFGEMAYRKVKEGVNCYLYSPGNDYFVEANSCDIVIYKFDLANNKMNEFSKIPIHNEHIVNIVFSSNYKWLTTLDRGGAIQIYYSIENAYELKFSDHIDCHSVAFSLDNNFLAFSGYNKVIGIFKLSESNKIVTKIHSNYSLGSAPISSMNFSPDGKYLASGSGDGLCIWAINNDNIQEIFKYTDSICVLDVCFSQDFRYLGFCGKNKENMIYLLDFPAKKIIVNEPNLKTLKGHFSAVNNINFNQDGNLLVSCSDDKTIRLWNLTELNCIQILTGHTDSVYKVNFTLDYRWLTSTSKDETARVWDLTEYHHNVIMKNNNLDNATLHSNYVYSVAFSSDEQWLASGSRDNTIRLWKVNYFKDHGVDNDHKSVILDDLKGFVYSVAFSLDGRWLAAGSDNGAYLYDAELFIKPKSDLGPFNLLVKQFNSIKTRSISFSHNSKLLALGNSDGKVRIFDLKDLNNQLLNKILRYEDKEEVYNVTFSHDDRWLAAGGCRKDNKVVLWDLSKWEDIQKNNTLSFSYHSKCVDSITFSFDNNWLATASWDASIQIYDLKKLEKAQSLKEHAKEVNTVAFSSDSKYLFSGDYGGCMVVWHLSASPINLWEKKNSIKVGFNIFSISYASNSNFVATGGSDNSVRVWLHDDDKLQLLNTTHQTILCAEKAEFNKETKLSERNKTLLLQRGALEEVDLGKNLLFSKSFGEIDQFITEENQEDIIATNLNSNNRCKLVV